MDVVAYILVYALWGCLIVAAGGLIVGVCRFFYYRRWRSDSVRVYYDDDDHRKGYYVVRCPRGPYPAGYPRERILSDMEEFEQLRRRQKRKRRAAADRPIRRLNRPRWLQILLMTPAEYRRERRSIRSHRD